MQNKGFVKVFAFALTLVCLFYLSFSLAVFQKSLTSSLFFTIRLQKCTFLFVLQNNYKKIYNF